MTAFPSTPTRADCSVTADAVLVEHPGRAKLPYGMAWRFRPGEMPSSPSSVANCCPNPAMRRVMYGQNEVSLRAG